MSSMPEWASLTMNVMSDLNPEYVDLPYPHIVLIEHFWDGDDTVNHPREEWFATLDTFEDTMHLAFRSGSYVLQQIEDRTPEDIAEWFNSKINEFYTPEFELLWKEIYGEDEA